MPSAEFAPDASFVDLEQTAHILANGFEFLLSEVESLAYREHDLVNRLDFAYNEVRRSLNVVLSAFMMRNQN
jgi:hypothetical protein